MGSVLSKQSHFELRDRNLYGALAERRYECLVDLRARRPEVVDGDPGLHGDDHRGVGETGDAYYGFGLLEHARIRQDDVTRHREGLVERRLVGDADPDVELADAAVVVQHLAYDLPVRDHDPRSVGMGQDGGEQADVHDLDRKSV